MTKWLRPNGFGDDPLLAEGVEQHGPKTFGDPRSETRSPAAPARPGESAGNELNEETTTGGRKHDRENDVIPW